MTRLFYSILFGICLPFVFLKLLWRGYKAPEYKARRFERFGIFKAPILRESIWFHTVSVGELLAAEPIIRDIQARFPDRSIVVTTMTPTSSELLNKLFGETVFHVYAPYDFPMCVNSFVSRIQPSCLIIMETELWPNIIHKMKAMQKPVIVANARMSERSAAGYRRLRPIIGWMLQGISKVLCQYDSDAIRFRSLGIKPEKISVTGSVKYDIAIPKNIDEEVNAIVSALPANKPLWIAASTHDGEDQLVLSLQRKLRKDFPELALIIVPRHPERFDSVYKTAESEGFRTFRRTVSAQIPEDADVFVVDTMGEMMLFYAASDVAFVGGSFVEIGGHNPLEPAVLSKPVIMGPHYFNFEAVCESLVVGRGLTIVDSEEGLLAELRRLISDRDVAAEMGRAGAEVVAKGRGAVERSVAELIPIINIG